MAFTEKLPISSDEVYYDAGLKEIAEASEFRGETTTTLQRCSNFKRTHKFLLQSCEAFYRPFLHAYVALDSSEADSGSELIMSDIVSATKARLDACDSGIQESKPADLYQEYLDGFRSRHPNL